MQYVYFDGDGIGRRLHALLINGETSEAGRLSDSVTRVLERIATGVRAIGWEIVFVGGDNLFARGKVDVALLERSMALFKAETGLTASVGVGQTAADAFLALTVAKSCGGGQMVWRRGGTAVHFHRDAQTA